MRSVNDARGYLIRLIDKKVIATNRLRACGVHEDEGTSSVPKSQLARSDSSRGPIAMATQDFRSHWLDRVTILQVLILFLQDAASTNFIRYHVAHAGQRHDNIASEFTAITLGRCSIECVKGDLPCYAFNYREEGGSCQLVFDGRSSLSEDIGYTSFVQWMCLTPYPPIENARVSFEGWNGENPAPVGAMVMFRCRDLNGFSDGSSIHTSQCSSTFPDAWDNSFRGDGVYCEDLTKYPECRLTEKGREYIGRASQTETGRECLRWDTQPYGIPSDFFENVTYNAHFPNLDAWPHQNYCRNPSGKERPWCFVADENVEWEFCDIPMCKDSDPPECKMTQQGGEYIGRKSVTHSGKTCQPWRNSEPQISAERIVKEKLPGFPDYEEIDEQHNFCRNPDGKAAPWCFNGEGKDPEYEYCDIPFCEIRETTAGDEGNVYPECRLTEKGKEYVGTKDVTETGKPCLDWASQPYGMPWDFFNQETGYEEHFLNGASAVHRNYCRNPTLYRERPWCFVSDPGIESARMQVDGNRRRICRKTEYDPIGIPMPTLAACIFRKSTCDADSLIWIFR
ncbi:unnamed protein product [Darwinula stevensoni]|uniref:Kringle domain-containing protein n=1 Tax=Darwinula stevensoni TaxID=69355 RepID=A0A7R9ADZ5_9CRUS|nr:unnamed protein product [Darwinula stevensoni]CAG0901179.1 unnamed protein product [Darwinula stevensoni]